jgi:hypothetical protein
MTSVTAAFGSPYAETSFRKIQAYANLSAYTVKWNPFDIFEIYATLQHQILKQPADRIIRYCCNYHCPLVETAAQASCDVIFAATFPDSKSSRRMNPVIARVETNHHLAER